MLLFVSTCRGKSFHWPIRSHRTRCGSPPFGGGIIEPAGVFGEMLNGIVNELSRFLGCRLHFLEARDDLALLTEGKPHQSGYRLV